MPNTIVCGIDRSSDARAAAGVLRSVVRDDVDLANAAIRLESGGAAERQAAAAQGAAMLVVGSRGEGAIRQTLLGSVSGALTRDPSRPVIVVPPRAVERGEPFLAGRCVVCGVRDRRDIADQEICVLKGATGPELEYLADARHAAIVAVGASDRSPLDAALRDAASRHLMRGARRPVTICPRDDRARCLGLSGERSPWRAGDI
jgi:nucleotide-binding universal stress UspA family protein